MDKNTNLATLDAYSKAWVSGESNNILPLLAENYELKLGADAPAITKPEFLSEWEKFREMVDGAGGPKTSENGNFITITNVVQKEIGEYAVEGGDWSIENFATGVYISAARDGKILWEEVSVVPWK